MLFTAAGMCVRVRRSSLRNTSPTDRRLEQRYRTVRGAIQFPMEYNTRSYFKENEAKVVCRMLGFNTSGIAFVFPHASNVFGQGIGMPMITSRITCRGDEKDLTLCQFSGTTWTVNPSYSHLYDVSISCEATQIRLTDGDTAMSGRVEINIEGSWSSVCDYAFDNNDARVICRMLGHADSGIAMSFKGSHFGQGLGKNVVNSLGCQGYETDIKQCTASWGHGVCTHKLDAGVNCGSTPIRLVNGPNNSSGRVEILHGGSWGTICGPRFDHLSTMVVCKMLGFNNTNAFDYTDDFYGEGTGPVITNNVACDGSEVDIANCPSTTWRRASDTLLCTHTQDVGVNCAGVTPIRLAGGPSEQSGRLEIYHNGNWGTVNSVYFDKHDLMVVCRMLGYEYSSKSFFMINSHYGPGYGEVVASGLQCNGAETDICQCGATWWPHATNDHRNDVGVNCDGEIPIRLVNGPTQGSGRVEVLHNGLYGTVCDRGFDRADLMVVCRMLGYEHIPRHAYWHTSSYFGQGLGEMVVSDLNCNGIENSIGNCPGHWPATTACDHTHDVSVSCDGSVEMVRLVDGRHNYSGRVEVFHAGGWGRICDYNFDRADAVVICRMMNMPHADKAVAHQTSMYGKGNGSLVASDLSCNGLETNLEQCNPTWMPTRCSGGDAGVDCCPSCASATIAIVG